jgi:tetratricopeptide (TPR) repeat protein
MRYPMALDPQARELLTNTQEERCDDGVRVVLDRARRSPDEAAPLLAEAMLLLESVGDWTRVLVLTNSALKLDQDDAVFADLLARKAWCLFWLGRPADAWDVLQNARQAAEKSGNAAALVRVFLVSGYVMDVRGEHERAFAWYTRAFDQADDAMKPHVLVEMATSLSKQGRLAEAISRFKEAMGLLVPRDAKHERLRFHILSRWAVALENLGDQQEALRLQDEAIAVARALGDVEAEFSALSRRVRTTLSAKRFDEARADLAAAEPLAAQARRGALHFAHDMARFHRAKGEWTAALNKYLEAMRLLPASPEIVTAFADIWGEILDGLEETLERGQLDGVDLVRAAHADLATACSSTGIYGGQPVTLDERRRRAAASADRLRDLLLGDNAKTFTAAGYVFNLVTGTATPLVAGGVPIRLDDQAKALLACLFDAPDHTASMADILSYSRKHGAPIPTAGAARKVAQRLRKRLGVGSGKVVRGLRGAPGGGFALVVDRT